MSETLKLISVRVESDLHRELRLLAAARDQSLGELCVVALGEWRAQQPEKVVVSTPEKELPFSRLALHPERQ